ncbi:response regulator [Enterovibrio paralichthyis]|uniref:GGDEF domain-containing response regulator n=1 Tax=Enterovibrio paralichthyis TaxID=2853805 RepID=UPI001C46E621|nr:response regulator [Enterovibrio paralichthyis]MBV7300533.1 response regulator [Enterovibrio paralichthyis]
MTESKHVLVVEDSPVFQQYIKDLLADAGYRTTILSSYADTELFLQDSPDLLCAVLDYNLPDAPRGEVIDHVLDKNYRTIVLTGNSNKHDRELMLNKGILDYLLKDSVVSLSFIVPLLNRLVRNKNKKALVVDDSLSMREYLSDLLERQNLTVISAVDGLDALEKYDQEPEICLVITDHAMPNMDGVALTHELRQIKTRDDLAIVGLSASKSKDLVSQFLKAGANDYLDKPFTKEELYCRLHSVLEIQDANAQLFNLANRDELTQLWNRRYFFHRAAQSPSPLKSVAMIDVDNFKTINDKYGHDGGDMILQALGSLLGSFFSTALPARFGGEEFVVLDTEDVNTFVDELAKLKAVIEDHEVLVGEAKVRFTVSIGMASGVQPVNILLRQADDNLYEAKRRGRNVLVY